MRIHLSCTYEELIALDNLLSAWQEFLPGKRFKKDVADFSRNLFDNLHDLHNDLEARTYKHGGYYAFSISDPKPRNIHKASVRDRILHHAIYRSLYPFFDRKFIYDSYSCRNEKGTHKAIDRLNIFVHCVGKNNTQACWILKCDITKFFASIDHETLLAILRESVSDEGVLRLLEQVIRSFDSGIPGKGLPLGNLTSQLLVNIYMNEFDQFVKHDLKMNYYIRYADDFVFLDNDRDKLVKLLVPISEFLTERLKLSLHPRKVSISTISSGVDFLGWVHFPRHRVLRTNTKRRMLNRIKESPTEPTLRSYEGLLSHGSTLGLKQTLQNCYGLYQNISLLD